MEVVDHIERIVRELADAERERLQREYPRIASDDAIWEQSYKPKCKEKRDYWNIDLGTSGAWMVEKSTGNLFGIDAYGVPNRRKYYGPVDLIDGMKLIRYRYHPPTCRPGCGIKKDVPGPQKTFWDRDLANCFQPVI